MVGPVFGWELVRTSRRKWHFWARVIYAGVLFLFLFVTFASVPASTSARALSDTANRFYTSLNICQFAAVCLLSPVYAAGSISDEKSRRTLDLMLASALRDWEIPLDKVMISVVRVWEVLLAGLPLCAFCFLFGGLAPATVFCDFFLATTAAWFGCALGVTIAIVSKRLVETLFVVFVLQWLWYALPATMISQWISSNCKLPLPIASGLATLLAGFVCVAVSWRWLRPSWQAHFDDRHWGVFRWLYWRIGRRRTRSALPVTGDPIRWKETRQLRATPFERLSMVALLLIVLSVIALQILSWQETRDAVRVGKKVHITPSFVTCLYYYVTFTWPLLVLPAIGLIGTGAFGAEKEKRLFEQLLLAEVHQGRVVNAKLLRALRRTVVMGVIAVLPFSSLYFVGWSSAESVALIMLRFAAAAAFWMVLGHVLGLRLRSSNRAVFALLTFMVVIEVVAPVALFATNTKTIPLATMGTSFTTLFEILYVEADLAAWLGYTLIELRVAMYFWIVFYSVAACGLYRVCGLPVAPWRRQSFMAFSWKSKKSTQGLPMLHGRSSEITA